MNKPLFEKVLIANRGEIALRIIKTLKKMGIKSVAVYSEADRNSIYVKMADESYYIGNSPSTESYLSISKIIDAIRNSGAQAVHPGYGFLSENANFAAALKKERVTLIGPSTSAIKQMGDKIEAKKLAIKAGINTVPGYIGIIDNTKQASQIAESLGFPVIVKAAAGGGGRGMRIVRNHDEMANAYKSATLEALNSFNDSRLFIEKFIEKPRHIEIQVLADKHGNIVCLGERECSIQRHHQKIIEEAPSAFIDEEIRCKMFAQSIALAREVGYYSAGTVEFIIDESKNFYFLEMNTPSSGSLSLQFKTDKRINNEDLIETFFQEHGFEIELKDSGLVVQVPPERTVMEALRSVNIDVQSDCGEGLCGSCEVRVLSGKVDHRDKVLTATERQSHSKMMVCCSRAQGNRLVLEL